MSTHVQPSSSLAQRTGLALAQALRHDCRVEPLHADGRIRRVSDLLIAGVEPDRLPDALAGSRFYRPVDRGLERELGERLARFRELREQVRRRRDG